MFVLTPHHRLGLPRRCARSRYAAFLSPHGLMSIQVKLSLQHPAPATMAAHLTCKSVFRSTAIAKPSIRAPLNKRFFSPTAFNMVKKAYFDCTWTGPEVTVDAQGNVTNLGGVKGELPGPLRASSFMLHCASCAASRMSSCANCKLLILSSARTIWPHQLRPL